MIWRVAFASAWVQLLCTGSVDSEENKVERRLGPQATASYVDCPVSDFDVQIDGTMTSRCGHALECRWIENLPV
jgi:hypothetical protein